MDSTFLNEGTVHSENNDTNMESPGSVSNSVSGVSLQTS